LNTSRRDFIVALFGGIVAAPRLNAIAEGSPVSVEFGPWFQPYCYSYLAEMCGLDPFTLSLAVDRNFRLRSVAWNAPEGAVFEVYSDRLELLEGKLFPGITAWPLMAEVAVPGGTELVVKLRNLPENPGGPHSVHLVLEGVREMTEEEVARSQTEWIDAEFEDEDDSDEWPDE